MSTRLRILTLGIGERLVTETCYSCGVLFAMVEDFYDHRLADRKNFYCPNGHSQAYVSGKTDKQKLEDAQAREVALKDQLEAAVRDAEAARAALLRDRHRFANGVCPCCNRTFENVARHMRGEHPEYDVTQVAQATKPLRGLHQHQTKQRGPNWFKSTASRWSAHLTLVGAE